VGSITKPLGLARVLSIPRIGLNKLPALPVGHHLGTVAPCRVATLLAMQTLRSYLFHSPKGL